MQLRVIQDSDSLSVGKIDAQVGMRLANGYKITKVHSESVVAQCNGHTDKFLAPESIFYTEATCWGFSHPTVNTQAENLAALVRKFRHGEAAHHQYVEYGYAPTLADGVEEAGYSFAKQVEAHRQIAIAQLEKAEVNSKITEPGVFCKNPRKGGLVKKEVWDYIIEIHPSKAFRLQSMSQKLYFLRLTRIVSLFMSQKAILKCFKE